MKIVAVNGLPGSGKTSFVDCCSKFLEEHSRGLDVIVTSVIEPIKQIATDIAWDGKKDFKGRRLLSDIKDALDEYENFTQEYIDSIITTVADVVFIDVRSKVDIDYLAKKYSAMTVFIENNRNVISEFSNHADEDIVVSGYHYNYYIQNNSTKEDLQRQAEQFIFNVII